MNLLKSWFCITLEAKNKKARGPLTLCCSLSPAVVAKNFFFWQRKNVACFFLFLFLIRATSRLKKTFLER